MFAEFTEGSRTTYQSGTVLLSTVMRHGVLSYEDSQKWRLSLSEAERLKKRYESTPTARVKLVTDDNGVAQLSVEVEVSLVGRLWNSCSIS